MSQFSLSRFFTVAMIGVVMSGCNPEDAFDGPAPPKEDIDANKAKTRESLEKALRELGRINGEDTNLYWLDEENPTLKEEAQVQEELPPLSGWKFILPEDSDPDAGAVEVPFNFN